MKKNYLEPEAEIVRFETMDIITASGNKDDYGEGGFGDWEGEDQTSQTSLS